MIEESFRCKTGEDIIIKLKSNPTTGYKWCILSSEGLTINDRYIPDYSEKGLCGVGGIEQLIITSENPGTFNLRLAYKREWEKGEGDVREYTLTFE